MRISDLIKIGTLGNSIDKDGMVKCNLIPDFIDIELRDLFLIFKNEKVRYVSVVEEQNSKNYRILLDDTEVMKEATQEKGVIIALAQEDIEDYFEIKGLTRLINYKVFENDQEIGIVINEFDNSAHAVITIQTDDDKEFMVPVVENYIDEIDVDNKLVVVKNIEQLKEL